MTESDLVRAIRLEAPKLGVTLFRNNVGMLEDKRGNKIRYGLCVGSSDLIGWVAEHVMAVKHPRGYAMVSRFVAIECKAVGKKATPQQLAFIDAVRASGGIAGVCYSVEDFRRIILES